MANITKRTKKDGTITYYVAIRKNNSSIYESFDDLETAELFVKYKEKIIDEMNAFNVPNKNLIRLKDGFNFKLEEMERENYTPRSIDEMRFIGKLCFDFFGEGTYMSDIKDDLLEEFVNFLLNKDIRRGGSEKSNTGMMKKPSLATIRRYLANLSSVYGFLQKEGILIENPVLPAMRKIKEEMRNDKNQQVNILE